MPLDPDTWMNEASLEAGLRAAGAENAAVDQPAPSTMPSAPSARYQPYEIAADEADLVGRIRWLCREL